MSILAGRPRRGEYCSALQGTAHLQGFHLMKSGTERLEPADMARIGKARAGGATSRQAVRADPPAMGRAEQRPYSRRAVTLLPNSAGFSGRPPAMTVPRSKSIRT